PFYVPALGVGVSLRLRGVQVLELVSGGLSADSMFNEQEGYADAGEEAAPAADAGANADAAGPAAPHHLYPHLYLLLQAQAHRRFASTDCESGVGVLRGELQELESSSGALPERRRPAAAPDRPATRRHRRLCAAPEETNEAVSAR